MQDRVGSETALSIILVVDDNLDDLKILDHILTRHGYKVYLASNEKAALSLVEADYPDLIMVNPEMKDMDINKICHLLKSKGISGRIPVIIIKSWDETTDREERFCFHEGNYISKPFRTKEVLKKVETYLSVSRLQKRIKEKKLEFQQIISERKRIVDKLEVNRQQHNITEMLDQMKNAPTAQIIEFTVQEAIKLTNSEFGFLGILSEDEKVSTMYSMSNRVKAQCNMHQSFCTFLVDEGGLWAETIRQRRTVIVNDYTAYCPNKKGLPDGHVKLVRFLSAPIFEGKKLVSFIIVANKNYNYNNLDILHINLLIEKMQRIIYYRKLYEEQLKCEENFLKTFYVSPAALVILNRDNGCFIEVNESFLKLFGFSGSEVIGRTPAELNIFVDPSSLNQIYKSLKGADSLQGYEVKLRTHTGDILTAILSMDVLQFNGQNCLIAYGIDITEQVRIDKELRESYRERKDTQKKTARLKKIAAKSIGIGNVYCFSDYMRQIAKDAQKYHGDRSIPVMIRGETGTGKELIAKLIHYGDLDAADSPFIALNCASITPGLFESELFGYEAGAFTGGLRDGQKGKFDLAKGGTLFFDEIAEIPLELQSKLLRVLEEKYFYRVGGLRKIKTNVRIICATNADLETRAQRGIFREDLYYRLRVGYINIPPLRERREAILPLATAFLKQASDLKGKTFKRIGPAAAEILQSYSWPGNIRELKNVIDSIVLMHDSPELEPLHLDMLAKRMNGLSWGNKEPPAPRYDKMAHPTTEQVSSIGQIKESASWPEIISQVECLSISLTKDGINLDSIIDEIINRALYINKGNKTETARYLGISRTALYNRLKKQKNKRFQ